VDSAGARTLRADAARNRRMLLDCARHAFARYGVTASLDEVARAAGVGAGTLYRHFPTRDSLVLAVIEDALINLCRLGATLLDEADAMAALRRWLDAYIEQSSIFDGLARTLASPPPAAGENSACRRARDAGCALLERARDAGLVREGITADDVLDMAAALAWIGEQPGRDGEQRTRLLVVLLDGLRTGTG
jgi:AcrR family transcriptional regulator